MERGDSNQALPSRGDGPAGAEDVAEVLHEARGESWRWEGLKAGGEGADRG